MLLDEHLSLSLSLVLAVTHTPFNLIFCSIPIIHLLRECYRGVTKVLQECNKGVNYMLFDVLKYLADVHARVYVYAPLAPIHPCLCLL
jgi:hypothetical protein